MEPFVIRFKQLKADEERRKMYNALQREEDQIVVSDSETDEVADGESKVFMAFVPFFPLCFSGLRHFASVL